MRDFSIKCMRSSRSSSSEYENGTNNSRHCTNMNTHTTPGLALRRRITEQQVRRRGVQGSSTRWYYVHFAHSKGVDRVQLRLRDPPVLKRLVRTHAMVLAIDQILSASSCVSQG
jgi:hypothetical protein